MNVEKIQTISNLIDERPIHSDESNAYVLESELEILNKVSDDIHYLERTFTNPLKIVLMGEVKAGKSTLLNALAGEQISNVGVTETTAAILELKHGHQKKASIHRLDESVEEFDADSLYNYLEKNRNNHSFFKEIKHIEMTYPINTLRELNIVDTPGVETITDDNQQTTINYIQKADVVLWVLSVHHLGQVGVDEQIMKVRNHGKPIIVLVNRIDQIDDDIDDVMEYVDEQYGLFIEKAFPISALNAFEGKKNKDENQYNYSGLPDVIEYLEKNIERSSTEVKNNSLQSSVIQLLEKEITVHVKINQKIIFLIDSIAQRKEDQLYYSRIINNKINQQFDYWKSSKFLKSEENYLISQIHQVGSKDKEKINFIKEKIKEYFGNDYLKSHVLKFLEDLSVEVKDERENALKAMGQKLHSEEEKSMNALSSYLKDLNVHTNDMEVTDSTDITEDLKAGAKQGAILGGTYGIAAATYSAVLGPYAAFIGIGSAIGAILPPVLLAGAATGAVWMFINKNKSNDNMSLIIKNSFDDIRQRVGESLNTTIKSIKNKNSHFFENVYREIELSMLDNNTVEDLMGKQEEIKRHIISIESELVNLKKDN